MTTKYHRCDRCRQLRIPAHMLGSTCIYCPKPGRPHLASPPMPQGFQRRPELDEGVTAHPAIKPPADALDIAVRRSREARG